MTGFCGNGKEWETKLVMWRYSDRWKHMSRIFKNHLRRWLLFQLWWCPKISIPQPFQMSGLWTDFVERSKPFFSIMPKECRRRPDAWRRRTWIVSVELILWILWIEVHPLIHFRHPFFFHDLVQENWCKILAVWNHFISEHLEFMVRPGQLARTDICFGWACGTIRKLQNVGGHCQPHLMSAISAAIWPWFHSKWSPLTLNNSNRQFPWRLL